MKKSKFTLKSETDIKVFLLFILEYMRQPVERTTLIDIVYDNTDEMTINYDECLESLVDSGHIYPERAFDETYYIITDSGKLVANELFDSLPQDFRERSLKIAIKHLSLIKRGATPHTKIEETEGTRYKVTLTLSDAEGDIFTSSFTVSSRSEAEKIRTHFENSPESVYRGVFFSATGGYEYLS